MLSAPMLGIDRFKNIRVAPIFTMNLIPNFVSFSVDTTGKMTATDGTFKGHLEARTGFIGQNTASGWNIDGSTITDTSGSIVIDATANSPNISSDNNLTII